MAQNYMMGAGMVPPPAPTQPSQLSFKSDPNQRMQFKSFMQGLSAPKAPMAPPMAPQMMPMPQIPVPMQNIDVFSQPVQFMARGGLSNRPVSEMRYTPENVEKERKTIRPRRERDDDDDDRGRGGILNPPTTNKQIAEANAIAAALSSSGPSDRYGPGSSEAKTVAELAGRYSTSQLPSGRTDSFDPNYITELLSSGLTNVDSMPMVEPVYDRISELDAEDGPPVDPRRSGLGSTLSEQISALRGAENFGDEFGTEDLLNQINAVKNFGLEFGDQEQQEQMQGIGNLIGRSIPPTGLDRFNPFSQLGTKMSGNILSKINEGGEAVRDDSGMIVGVVHDGFLGGKVYTGRPEYNPFASPTRPEREVNPCPPGYTLINGACMPISQPTQATTTTPAPNVIQNVPVTAPAPSPVVQSTAPPAQLGMPLGQPTPIQPMNQFLTNIPNSLNLAANNFLSALSS